MMHYAKNIWVDETNTEIPETDNRIFSGMQCEDCGNMECVSRYRNRWLCLGCVDENEEQSEAIE